MIKNIKSNEKTAMISIHEIFKAASDEEHGALKIQEIQNEYPNINEIKNGEGWSALHLAAYYGHLPAAKVLLENKANVNSEDLNGSTPLHKAAVCGNAKLVELLLEKSSNINAVNQDENTPLHLASLSGNLETVKLLLEKCVDVKSFINATNKKKETALHG